MLTKRTWEPVTYQGDGFTITMDLKRLGFLEEKAFSIALSKTKRGRLQRMASVAMTESYERMRALLGRLNAVLVEHGHAAIAEGDDLTAAGKAAEAALEAHGLSLPVLTADELNETLAASEGRMQERDEALREFLESLDDAWLVQVFTNYVQNVAGLEVDGKTITTGAELLEFADHALVMYVIHAIEGFAKLSGAAKKASSSPPTSEPVAGTADGESPVTSAAHASGTALGTATDPQAAESSTA